ncbi:MAG: DJ-1/PfpI family protein [Ignavibacteriae bacterium]|nr:DJ-1/PfpI family protein [Ignavibacteria bacterium]MBI3364192.1 DJ-1/PfpI family protein [Ignavibacteriota bacterium]
MAFVDREQAQAATDAHVRKKVGILIFDGVQIIDYTGPYEVFGAAGFEVYTVAETKQPVTTAMGMTVIPKYSFADAPQPDVLVVPGGGVKGTQNNTETLKWITDVTSRAQHTMSVCNGAFILASAGLLDGLTATTTAGNIDRLKADFPKTKVVYDQRYVDNGKIITTAGLSSGIDGALHVVSKILGNGTAEQVALGEEYDWYAHSKFARASLADRLIPDLDFDGTGNWEIDRTEGGANRWKLALHGTSNLSANELLERFNLTLSTTGRWTNVKTVAPQSASLSESDWKFTGRDGKPWKGFLKIQTISGDKHQFAAKLNISREAK